MQCFAFISRLGVSCSGDENFSVRAHPRFNFCRVRFDRFRVIVFNRRRGSFDNDARRTDARRLQPLLASSRFARLTLMQ